MKIMILLMGLLFWSCEDDRAEEPLVESIQMWVNGTEIIAREYYESITTYGAATVQEDGSVKKIFVLHFQREDGRDTIGCGEMLVERYLLTQTESIFYITFLVC